MNKPSADLIDLAPEVADALASGGAVVALESTILSHGLPRDSSLEVGGRIEGAVRSAGAVPATIALIDGRVKVGLGHDDLVRITQHDDVAKVSVRDVPAALARRAAGATTVASTSWLASLAGVRVFATGGLGGVHREAQESYDESADLVALSRVPVTVVCAGVKSILDVPATLERLETLSVAVLGYRTSTFPGFYIRDTGLELPWRVETADEIAEVMRARDALGVEQGLVIANPVDEDRQLDRDLHDQVLAAALTRMRERGIRGKDVTPFLLSEFHEQTHGASLRVNIDLVLSNARLAGEIAVAAARQ
ncbi:MAG: pseudouridine-5'-phosphate glycosidase [Actinomycetales bacterium]